MHKSVRYYSTPESGDTNSGQSTALDRFGTYNNSSNDVAAEGQRKTKKTKEKLSKSVRSKFPAAEDDSFGVPSSSMETFDLTACAKPSWKNRRLPRIDAKSISATDDADADDVKYNSDEDPYPDRAPVDEKKVKAHSRYGDKVKQTRLKKHQSSARIMQREQHIEFAAEQAARSEILLREREGFLEADVGEATVDIRQGDLSKVVDITSATKHFDLDLERYGPYRMCYTRNGRHLVLGGRLGHVAALDWVTKELKCEFNVMQSVHDVQWLHNETMFAVAQKDWLHMYDNTGIELHCVKKLFRIQRMEFLPYHFLLATGSDQGFLSYLDVSIGKMVAQHATYMGPLNIMTQNPHNAVIVTGHSRGTVTMWTPSVKSHVVKMLCHFAALRGISITQDGRYMATAAVDRSLKVWDLRTFKCLSDYTVGFGVNSLSFSQRGLLAAGLGNIVEVYKDVCGTGDVSAKPYLRHRTMKTVCDINFCPYEDVLGIGHERGFTSMLVPGAGEPNYDAMEVNPFQSVRQRREAEVKQLLDKIQPELITLDPTMIGDVDVSTLKERVDERTKRLHINPPNINFKPRKKSRGGGSVKESKVKKHVIEQQKKDYVKSAMAERKKWQSEDGGGGGVSGGKQKKNREWKQGGKNFKSVSVLDRFVKKPIETADDAPAKKKKRF